ncbi:hypothetical protein EV102420_26_00370 [Pseudescherichia vulneris NBRC 102420]|uniref:Uncharacterized protein n=1 Tax=Pseudescherichia vulneris NBRC 102420 TaxID=1115515 RepID=A0A090VXS6_PSEVU|nr:hypothetical protein EV102420_26_00370 [Pseudescherichia vulneris NBRC 102420]
MRPASSNFIPAPPFRKGIFSSQSDSANGTDGSMGAAFVGAKSREEELSAIADGALKFDVGDNPSGPLIRTVKVA